MTKFQKTLLTLIASTSIILGCFYAQNQIYAQQTIYNETTNTDGSIDITGTIININTTSCNLFENNAEFLGISFLDDAFDYVYKNSFTFGVWNSYHSMSFTESCSRLATGTNIMIAALQVQSIPSGNFTIHVCKGNYAQTKIAWDILGVYAGQPTVGGYWMYIVLNCSNFVNGGQIQVTIDQKFVNASNNARMWPMSRKTYSTIAQQFIEVTAPAQQEIINNSVETNNYNYYNNYDYSSTVINDVSYPIVDSSSFTSYMEPIDITLINQGITQVQAWNSNLNTYQTQNFYSVEFTYDDIRPSSSCWLCLVYAVNQSTDFTMSDVACSIYNTGYYKSCDVVALTYPGFIMFYINTFNNSGQGASVSSMSGNMRILFRSNVQSSIQFEDSPINQLYYAEYGSNLGLQISEFYNNLTNVRFGTIFENIEKNTDTIADYVKDIYDLLANANSSSYSPSADYNSDLESIITNVDGIADDVNFSTIDLTDNKYKLTDSDATSMLEDCSDLAGDMVDTMEDNGAGIIIWIPIIIILIGVIV